MLPVFTQPAAFWALLALPALVAIHFLQNKSRLIPTSTLFLLDALAPESRSGRIWDKFRHSARLWFQMLTVLLIVWVLLQPRWANERAGRTVVFVLDDLRLMNAFKKEAEAAVKRDMETVAQSGIPTEWIIMTSSAAQSPLYRGTNADRAFEHVRQWTPGSDEHDPKPALNIAAAVAGPSGSTRLVTCAPSRIPASQCGVSVGRPVDNVGFVGITPTEKSGLSAWRVAIKNHSPRPATRTLTIEENGRKWEKTLHFPPLSLQEELVSVTGEKAVVRLSPDEFTGDDTLPLARRTPRLLTVRMELGEKYPRAQAFLSKLTSSLPGVEAVATPSAHLRIGTTAAVPEAGGPALLFSEKGVPVKKLSRVTPESHPLTQNLNWEGLLLSETGTLSPGEKAVPLLWLGDHPLAWLEDRTLILNFPPDSGNIDRLPATALMIRRFLESAQKQTDSFFSGNAAVSSRLPLPDSGKLTFFPLNEASSRTVPFDGRAPRESGFFEIRAEPPSDKLLYQGASFYADPRQGDFSRCDHMEQGDISPRKLTEKLTTPDPFASLWLALAGLAALLSWMPEKRERKDLFS